VYQQAVEPARQAKTIAKSLEASVTLEIPSIAHAQALDPAKTELEEFFIISELNFAPGLEIKASLAKSAHTGCARCWRYLPTVGTVATHPDLCDRCAEAVLTCVPA
jgi:isoleucyl-tRNA synthetase